LIYRYLSPPSGGSNSGGDSLFWGNDLKKRAEIAQWCEFARESIHSASCAFILSDNEGFKALKEVMKTFNDILHDRTFLVGERFSLADAVAAAETMPALLSLESTTGEGSARRSWPHVTRWFNTCAAQPSVKKVIGEVKFV